MVRLMIAQLTNEFVILGAVAVAALGVGLLFVWRYWALRTWRTLSVIIVGSLAAGASVLFLPYGAVLAPLLLAATVWLVASGRSWLMSISRADHSHAEALRLADEEARRILSASGTNDSPEAIAAVDRIISELALTPAHPAWEPARTAKIQELELAKSILTGTATDPDADVKRLGALRERGRELYLEARRTRTSFWSAPPTNGTRGAGS